MRIAWLLVPTALLHAAGPCVQPLCVNRIDDNAASPVSGMLRYAVQNAAAGSTITFDSRLSGLTITLDGSSPNNHIKITKDVTIQGLGTGLLTISGGNATRIFFVASGNVMITAVTLANGFAKGGDGSGGAAGMCGAIYQNGGIVTLTGVVFSGNAAQGGSSGSAPGGGGFGGSATSVAGGPAGDLPGANGGDGGIGLLSSCSSGGNGGFGAGGGAGGSSHGSPQVTVCPGGNGGFGGGGGSSGGTGGFGGGNNGGGGAGFGGAIFAANGGLQIFNTTFQNNSTTAGTGTTNGRAKGAALFICSPGFCGSGHAASVVVDASDTFSGSLAADAASAPFCPGSDTLNICGILSATTPTHFSVTAPSLVTAGVAFPLTISALDSNNNVVFLYGGTVHFTSSDPSAALPADTTLLNGTATFLITFRNPGTQIIVATDTANTTLTGTSNAIAAGSSTPTTFSISAPAVATPGLAFTITVNAVDANNIPVIAYNGAVHFSSSDTAAILPADMKLSNGTGTFAVTLKSGGPQTVTVSDSVFSSISGNSQSIVVNGTGQPNAFGMSPNFGTGASSNFAFNFYDPYGWQDLQIVNILINNVLDGRRACYLAYVVATGSLLLVDDAGDAGGPFAGSQNSQCGVSVLSANGSAQTLILNLAISFNSGFGGNKVVYMAGRYGQQAASGWQASGVWQVPFTSAGTITVGAATPAGGGGPAGSPQNFTFTVGDQKAATDLGIVNVLINNAIDGRQACYLAFSESTDSIFLVNDLGQSGGPFAGSAVLNGSSAAIQNSQCVISGVVSTSSSVGNTLTLTLDIVFKQGFTGNKIIYVAGRDGAGNNNTDWQAIGTWTVQ